MAVDARPRRSVDPPCSVPGDLVERYFMDVYAVCFRVLGRSHDAEDATQEAFLELFRGWDRVKEAGSVRAWVLAVARNTAVSIGRKRRPTRPLPEAAAAEPLDAAPDAGRLGDALAALSEEERHLIQLRFQEGKGPAEIGEALGKAPGAAATALCRALKRLRSFYAGGGEA